MNTPEDIAHLAACFRTQRTGYRYTATLLLAAAGVLLAAAAVLVAYGEEAAAPAFYALGALLSVGTAVGCALRACGDIAEARSLSRAIKTLEEDVRL